LNPQKLKAGLFTRGGVLLQQLKVNTKQYINDRRVNKVAGALSRLEPIAGGKAPIIIFNASTRINGLSQNAGFSILTAWAL
jgi:hypothetical protein